MKARQLFDRLRSAISSLLPSSAALADKKLKFQQGRRVVSDDQYLEAIAAGAADPRTAEVLISLRQVVADMCGVSKEMLHADDSAAELDHLMGILGFDYTLFIQLIEQRLNVRLDDSLRVPWPPGFTRSQTLGQWILAMGPWLLSRS